jgi:hypothetical protein
MKNEPLISYGRVREEIAQKAAKAGLLGTQIWGQGS